jgi:hypothetical protein
MLAIPRAESAIKEVQRKIDNTCGNRYAASSSNCWSTPSQPIIKTRAEVLHER